MSENIEESSAKWEALYQSERYRIPVRKLSPNIDRHFRWEASNPQHPVPIEWLRHYASAFHFSDDELLAGRVTHDMPAAEGVYFLFDDDECIYVGESQNIGVRSQQHEDRGVRWTSHAYIEVPKLFTREVEAYYIRRLKPALNNDFPRLSMYSDIVKTLGLDKARAPSAADSQPT